MVWVPSLLVFVVNEVDYVVCVVGLGCRRLFGLLFVRVCFEF